MNASSPMGLLRKAVSRRTLLIAVVGAIAWCAAFVLSGPAECVGAVGRGLSSFGFVFGISAVSLAFRATSWKIALAAFGRTKASLVAVLKASMGVGGTPVRLALLKKRTGIADGAGSVIADRSASSSAVLVFTCVGLFFGFLLTPGAIIVRGLMLIAAVGGTGYAVIAAKRGSRKQRGLFLSLLNGAGVFSKRFFSPAIQGCFEERDRYLAAFRGGHPTSFYASFLIHLTVLALGAVEIFAIGRAIDSGFPGPLALALAAAIQVFRFFSFTPFAFGLLEIATASLLALTFGAPLAPVGFAIVTILRLKTLAWWAIGLVICGNPAKILLSR